MRMYIEKFIYVKFLKDELRKIGVNLLTAGIVGIFINHFVGTKLSTMFWSSFIISITGLIFLFIGLLQEKKNDDDTINV